MPVAAKKKPSAVKRVRAVMAKAARRTKTSREEWLRHLRAEYTQKVCEQTLTLNESLPLDGEP